MIIEFLDEPISEKWLKEIQLESRNIKGDPYKHYFFWIGNCIPGAIQLWGADSLALEISQDEDPLRWYCWIVQDYNKPGCAKSVFARFLFNKGDFMELAEALTGQEWDASNILPGGILIEPRLSHTLAAARISGKQLKQAVEY